LLALALLIVPTLSHAQVRELETERWELAIPFPPIEIGEAWAGDLDSQGNIVLADSTNNRVVRIAADGQALEVLASGPLTRFPVGLQVDDDDSIYVSAQNTILHFDPAGQLLNQWTREQPFFPVGLQLDGKGGLLIAEAAGFRVLRLDLESGELSTFAEVGGSRGAVMGTPHSLTLGADGTLWVADAGRVE
jgi:sugar lactone lactonase YvrE